MNDPGESALRIEYENSFWDAYRHQLGTILFLWPIQALILLALVPAAIQVVPTHGIIVAAISVIVFGVIFLIFQAILAVFVTAIMTNRSVLTRHVIELEDEGLREETAFNRSVFYWDGIHKVVDRWGMVSIYVAPGLAHLIPHRAFESADGRLSFVQEVRRRIDAAKLVNPA
ncbi:MAG: YcxB family protein [Lysobacteraceae bacterium]